MHAFKEEKCSAVRPDSRFAAGPSLSFLDLLCLKMLIVIRPKKDLCKRFFEGSNVILITVTWGDPSVKQEIDYLESTATSILANNMEGIFVIVIYRSHIRAYHIPLPRVKFDFN